jgi:hypothetical protein
MQSFFILLFQIYCAGLIVSAIYTLITGKSLIPSDIVSGGFDLAAKRSPMVRANLESMSELEIQTKRNNVESRLRIYGILFWPIAVLSMFDDRS